MSEEEIALIDTRECLLIVTVDPDGGSNIKAQNGTSHQQAAQWLRQIADTIEDVPDPEAPE